MRNFQWKSLILLPPYDEKGKRRKKLYGLTGKPRTGVGVSRRLCWVVTLSVVAVEQKRLESYAVVDDDELFNGGAVTVEGVLKVERS